MGAPSLSGDGDGFVEIAAGRHVARIAARGAEVVSWTAAGRELLWSGDPDWWPKVSPILFPIVGRVRDGRILVDGVAYPLGIHGFAASQRFTLVEASADAAGFELRDSAETLACYPFRFTLSVRYRLTEFGLSIGITVANRGDAAMPYAVGVHPGFRWPLADRPRDGHAVRFAAQERAEVPVLSARGLFTDRMRPVPLAGRVLPLSDALFEPGALCFLDAASPSMTYEASPDGPAIRLVAENLPHLALWTQPGAGFLCLEAWSGHGDPDDFTGELWDKPSMRVLQPGASATHGVTLELRGR